MEASLATESNHKPNRRHTTHGLSLAKRALREHGTRALDRRTSLSKALDRWRDDLIADLGGSQQVTTQQHAVVNLAIKTKLLLDSIDGWLLQQPTLVNARKRALLPVVLQRQQLANSLARYMTQLGLERRAKQVPDLASYLAAKEAAPQSGEHH